MSILELQRLENETWRQTAARQAEKHGLRREVLEAFDAYMESHPEQDEALAASTPALIGTYSIFAN